MLNKRPEGPEEIHMGARGLRRAAFPYVTIPRPAMTTHPTAERRLQA